MSKTLEELSAEHEAAKAAEKEANAKRVAIEKQIIEATGFEKAEGSQIYTPDGFKITLTAKMNVTIDEAGWRTIEDDVPETARPIKSKLSLDGKKFKALRDMAPELYKMICSAAIVSKPAKTAVKVERVAPKEGE